MQSPKSANQPFESDERRAAQLTSEGAVTSLAPTGPATASYSETSGAGGDLLPDEIPFSLTRMEYRVLCTAEINQSRAGRNFFLGLLASSLIGLAAVSTSVDWAAAFHQVHLVPFVWVALLFAVVICSICSAVIQHRHFQRDNRPYYALMTRLRQYYEEEQTQF
jgi:hypothetical protein